METAISCTLLKQDKYKIEFLKIYTVLVNKQGRTVKNEEIYFIKTNIHPSIHYQAVLQLVKSKLMTHFKWLIALDNKLQETKYPQKYSKGTLNE